MTPLQIPDPPAGGFFIGPVEIRYYAICILVGIFIAAWLSRRRFVQRGGDADRFDTIALILVVVGIIGARLYHVITDYQLYFGPGRNPWQAFNIRSGGLGIWAAPILMGMYWKRATKQGAIASVVVGVAVYIAITMHFKSWALGFNPLLVSWCIAMLVHYVVSLATSPNSESTIRRHFELE